MKATRESIISNMCMTWRHDYGLQKSDSSPLSSGMTDEERKALWRDMAQIFDNDIMPVFESFGIKF